MDYWTLILEAAKGAGRFFLHPLFYIGFFYAIYLGYIRVKRERQHFHIRIQDGWLEFRTYSSKGLILGLFFSMIIFFLGFTVPVAYIFAAGIVTFFLALTTKPSFLSPAYTLGIAFILLWAYQWVEIEIPVVNDLLNDFTGGIVPGAALLTGLLLLVEGILIEKNAVKHTSPKIIKSRRGLNVGVHESKRLWMVPLLLLLPEGVFSIPFDFWPVLPIANDAFSIIIVPFWIGFSQQIDISLPAEGIKLTGRRVFIVGSLVTILAVGGYWYPLLSSMAIGIAIIGRAIIPFIQHFQNKANPYYFSKSEPGIVVLDIIPGSPADKMELKIGEIIKTVNGVPVNDEKEYYAALQKNRAFCKLEVIDYNGENRLVNRALFEGDHHELGVLFVSENRFQEE